MSKEIKISNRFSIEKDPHCWVLYEKKKSKNRKTNKEAIVTKSTYHGNIKQIIEVILDREAEDCKSLEEIIDLFENAVERLTEAIQEKVKPTRRRRG